MLNTVNILAIFLPFSLFSFLKSFFYTRKKTCPVMILFAFGKDGNKAVSKHPRQSGPDQPKTQTKELGHSLVHLHVRSNRSLIRTARTARFARALCCAHSFARSLRSLPRSMDRFIRQLFCLGFFLFSTIVNMSLDMNSESESVQKYHFRDSTCICRMDGQKKKCQRK